MRYEICTVEEIIRSCRHLFADQWSESGQYKQKFSLDWNLYSRLTNDDAFGIIAYDGDEVAGYVSVFLSIGQHTSLILAYNDAIYVRPEYRRTGLGGRLFYMAEEEARRRGAKHFQWACDFGSPLHYALAKRKHGTVQVVYEREL